MSIYSLKPRFQALLRPGVTRLHGMGVTANQVTVAACFVSVALGLALAFAPVPRSCFLLIPLWMFLRMALNAMDGMLAREFGQKSTLGAYLNELTDVVSDAALYLPFAFVAPFGAGSVGAVIFFSAVSELAGVLAQTTGASRRYDGPMGKSDRAFVFGALALWIGAGGTLPTWSDALMWGIAALTALTVVNRVRAGLRESNESVGKAQRG
ncbi:MAG TPA: CDP-alcohol phosphatidyltransferase family protein [Burkholderiales bacterium]|nr:CDP-alcohol phosphatidyltransferase family protein [Burkholderiales bacterium]